MSQSQHKESTTQCHYDDCTWMTSPYFHISGDHTITNIMLMSAVSQFVKFNVGLPSDIIWTKTGLFIVRLMSLWRQQNDCSTVFRPPYDIVFQLEKRRYIEWRRTHLLEMLTVNATRIKRAIVSLSGDQDVSVRELKCLIFILFFFQIFQRVLIPELICI